MSTLTAPSKAAATAQLLTENWLRNVFPTDLYTIRVRAPEAEGERPAIMVTHAHTTDSEPPVLVVEVSEAPVTDEIAEDAGRYATTGIRDFWIIDVSGRKLHTFRDPQIDSGAKHGARYVQVRAHSPYALVSPLAAEIHLAQVINLLPW
jgi:Uma2 family endonuclease